MKSSPALSQTSESDDRGKNVAREDKAGEEKGKKKDRERAQADDFFPKECEETGQCVCCSLSSKRKDFGRSAEGLLPRMVW